MTDLKERIRKYRELKKKIEALKAVERQIKNDIQECVMDTPNEETTVSLDKERWRASMISRKLERVNKHGKRFIRQNAADPDDYISVNNTKFLKIRRIKGR